jgi:intracellular multiplication protein IcmE
MNAVSARLKIGFFNSAGRAGPQRLVIIVGVGLGMIAVVVGASLIRDKTNIESRVAKMKPGNLLPGGLHSTPAQDAVLIEHAQREAAKAAAKNEGYTPPMAGSIPLVTPETHEVGLEPAPKQVASLDVHMVPAPAPVRVAPERRADPPPVIEKISSNPSEYDPEPTLAGNDLFRDWDIRAPRTDIVLPPAAIRGAAGGVPGEAETARPLAPTPVVATVTARNVLVPAGRGVYAHTIVSVNSDTGGPIILEADTGPLAGDRLLGTFAKTEGSRLIVRVSKIEHRGASLEATGIVVAPESMETSVASAIDEHYAERFIIPGAAAFISGVGQALAFSNATTTVSPFGGTSTSFGHLNFNQQLGVGAGAAAGNVGSTLEKSIPKGPTIALGANVAVGVMFLSDVVTAK